MLLKLIYGPAHRKTYNRVYEGGRLRKRVYRLPLLEEAGRVPGQDVATVAFKDKPPDGAAGKDCNERNSAMRSCCYDAATCRCLASIRLAVLLVVDSPPSLRTERHFIKKVLVVVACPLCGSIRSLRHCVLSVRLLFVP